METAEQYKKQYDWLKPYQWKKGQSGNPTGRKIGSKSLKQWVREYFHQLDDEEKMEFLKEVPPDLAWKMAEGNPETKIESTVDLSVNLKPQEVEKLNNLLNESKTSS